MNWKIMWKKKSECLSIHEIEISAPIGVFDFEKKAHNRFLVSVDIWGDFSSASTSDHLEDTLDYQVIFQIAHDVLHQGGNLIEHSCHEIAKRICSIDFPMNKIRVFIQKLNPPLQGIVADTRFEIILER